MTSTENAIISPEPEEFDYENFDFSGLDKPGTALIAPSRPVEEVNEEATAIDSVIEPNHFGMKVVTALAWADGTVLTADELKVHKVVTAYLDGKQTNSFTHADLVKMIAATEFSH